MYEFIHKIDNQLGTSDPDPEPRQHYEVHCGKCGWWGYREDLHSKFGCPMCLSNHWLEYREED